MRSISPVAWQRLEAAVLFAASVISIHFTHQSWWWLACILLPDIFILGYLKDNAVGAFVYNLGHTFIFPLILLLGGLFWSRPLFVVWACVWLAHIGMDRMVGYGLKHTDSFKQTHLGNLGK